MVFSLTVFSLTNVLLCNLTVNWFLWDSKESPGWCQQTLSLISYCGLSKFFVLNMHHVGSVSWYWAIRSLSLSVKKGQIVIYKYELILKVTSLPVFNIDCKRLGFCAICQNLIYTVSRTLVLVIRMKFKTEKGIVGYTEKQNFLMKK